MIDYDDPDFELEVSDTEQALIDEIEADLDSHRYAFSNPMSTDALEELMGRAATKEEQLHLLKMQKKLNISNDDALWYLLIGLQYHLTLYQQIPLDIDQTTKRVIHQACLQIRHEADVHLMSISDEATKQRKQFTVDIEQRFNALSQRLNKSIVKLVSEEIEKTRKKTHWTYVWGAVSAVLTILLGVTMMVAMLRPEILGG